MKQQIREPKDVKQLGTILSVWAHPDDESFSCAGIMATAVSNGQQVICVTATKGEAGVQDPDRWPVEKLPEIRTAELKAALKTLGIANHHWLGYVDGECAKADPAQAAKKIRDLIDTYKADTILTFGPDGWTGHSDHQIVSYWVSQAVKGSDIKVYHVVEEERRYIDHMIEFQKYTTFYLNNAKPTIRSAASCDIALQLNDDLLNQKCQCLKKMPSQMEAVFNATPESMLNALLAQECFVLASSDN